MQKNYNVAGDYDRRSNVAHTLQYSLSGPIMYSTLLLQHSGFHGSVVMVRNPITFPFHWSTFELHNTCVHCFVYGMQSFFCPDYEDHDCEGSNVCWCHHESQCSPSGKVWTFDCDCSGSIKLVLVLMFQQRKSECGTDTHI